MRDFDTAKELFIDIIDTTRYFDSISAEITKDKILNAINNENTPLIFVLANPGEGKSYMLRYIESIIKKDHMCIFIDHPFFNKTELLKILYEAKNINFDEHKSFNQLKTDIIKVYKNTQNTIFIDEAQLLNIEDFEFIRILNDSKVFQFVIAMHKKEGLEILKKEHFKSRSKIVIYLQPLNRNETERYITTTLLMSNLGDIAQIFKKKDLDKIYGYTKGNFRNVKRFLYSTFTLLDYAKKNSLLKYQNPNNCLLTMAALDIGVASDKK